jgi:hypothetical protein
MPLSRRGSKIVRRRSAAYLRQHRQHARDLRERESVFAYERRKRKMREYIRARRARLKAQAIATQSEQQHVRRESSANTKPRIRKCTHCGDAGHNRRTCTQRARVVHAPRAVTPKRRAASKKRQSRAPLDTRRVTSDSVPRASTCELRNRGRLDTDQQSWVEGAKTQHSLQTRTCCAAMYCM